MQRIVLFLSCRSQGVFHDSVSVQALFPRDLKNRGCEDEELDYSGVSLLKLKENTWQLEQSRSSWRSP